VVPPSSTAWCTTNSSSYTAPKPAAARPHTARSTSRPAVVPPPKKPSPPAKDATTRTQAWSDGRTTPRYNALHGARAASPAQRTAAFEGFIAGSTAQLRRTYRIYHPANASSCHGTGGVATVGGTDSALFSRHGDDFEQRGCSGLPPARPGLSLETRPSGPTARAAGGGGARPGINSTVTLEKTTIY
jgi:hypothetical protein